MGFIEETGAAIPARRARQPRLLKAPTCIQADGLVASQLMDGVKRHVLLDRGNPAGSEAAAASQQGTWPKLSGQAAEDLRENHEIGWWRRPSLNQRFAGLSVSGAFARVPGRPCHLAAAIARRRGPRASGHLLAFAACCQRYQAWLPMCASGRLTCCDHHQEDLAA